MAESALTKPKKVIKRVKARLAPVQNNAIGFKKSSEISDDFERF